MEYGIVKFERVFCLDIFTEKIFICGNEIGASFLKVSMKIKYLNSSYLLITFLLIVFELE